MAVRLFLVEACGEVIPCLRDVELWHYEMAVEGAAEFLWFKMILKLVKNSAEIVGTSRQKGSACRQTGCHV